MLMLGNNFIPLFAKGNKQPTVIFRDGKIVYSKYVVFGTTYNTQDFTYPYAIRQDNVDVPHDWHVEVLGKAGTDPDNGDYYYCGLLNDKQDVTAFQNPQNIISVFAAGTTNLIRDVLWTIPFSDLTSFEVAAFHARNNTYLKSFDFSLSPNNYSSYNFSNAFAACTNLESIPGLATFCQALANGASFVNFIVGNQALTELDMRGYTKWYTLNGPFSLISGATQLRSIYFSESDSDNRNWVNVTLNSMPLVTSIDWAKLRVKMFSGINFANSDSLQTLTGLSGSVIRDETSAYQIFRNDYNLLSDPEVNTWVGEDGTSKPLVSIANTATLWQNCGRDVPAADRSWEIDIRGWRFRMTQYAYQDNGNTGWAMAGTIGNVSGYGVRIAGIKALPFSTNTWVVMNIGVANNSFLDSTIDYDSMVDSQYDIYIGSECLYQAFMNSTNITKVKFGRAQVGAYNGNIQNYAFTRTFQGASNLSDMDLRVKHFNVYRNIFNTQTQQYETALATFQISQATAWTDTTQLGNLIGDLTTTQSEQYRVNGIPFSIQFNAAQEAVIKALPNWATMEGQIASNGWNLIWPVSVNGVPANINMSELE